MSDLSPFSLILVPMQELLTLCRQALPEAVRLLEQMVSMESPSFDKELTDAFVQFVAGQFHGGEVNVIPAEKFGNHLRVRFGGSAGNRVLLLGHTDTVWPAGDLARRP